MNALFVAGLVFLLLGMTGIAMSRVHFRGADALMSWVLGVALLIVALLHLVGGFVLWVLR